MTVVGTSEIKWKKLTKDLFYFFAFPALDPDTVNQKPKKGNKILNYRCKREYRVDVSTDDVEIISYILDKYWANPLFKYETFLTRNEILEEFDINNDRAYLEKACKFYINQSLTKK